MPLYRKAAEAGDHRAVIRVVNWPGIRDDREAVEAVYRAAVAAGDLQSLSGLAGLRARQGDNTRRAGVLPLLVAATGPAARVSHGGRDQMACGDLLPDR